MGVKITVIWFYTDHEGVHSYTVANHCRGCAELSAGNLQQAVPHGVDYILVVLLLLLRNLCLYCSKVPWKGFTVPLSTCQSSSTVEEMRCWSWLTINTPPWNVASPCTQQTKLCANKVHGCALAF